MENLKQKIYKLMKDKERNNKKIEVVQNEEKILENYSKCVSAVSLLIN